MKEELNERFEIVGDSIGTVYHKLTFLNMRYHHMVRELEKTKEEMKKLQKELTLICRLEGIEDEGDPCIIQLKEAPRRLYAGLQIVTDIFPKLKNYVKTVDRLMDANDEVETCLNLLDEFREQGGY